MANYIIFEIAETGRVVKVHRDDWLQFKTGDSFLQSIDKDRYANYFEALSNANKTEGRAIQEIKFLPGNKIAGSFFITIYRQNKQLLLIGASSPEKLDSVWNEFQNDSDHSTPVGASVTTPGSYAEYNKALNKLSEVNNEMATLQRELNQKNMLLEQANADLESFSYAVSHDLHAPVRGIIGFSELLEKKAFDKLDPDSQKLLIIIKENAIRMRELIKDLLQFSKMSKQGLVLLPVCTQKLVEQVVKDVLQLNPGRNIDWNIHDLADTPGDEKMLYQVWINLISNAVKYSQKKETALIEICSYEKDKELVFYVKDNGAGFDNTYKNKLFKVFQRLHGNKDFEGTGIGLANVHKIVTKHGGRVWAEGEVGKGAAFYFSLPVKPTGKG